MIQTSYNSQIPLWEEGSIITIIGGSGLPSDFDGTVGFSDFIAFVQRFGTKVADGSFDSKFDLIKDGSIGFTDFVQFAKDFGKAIK